MRRRLLHKALSCRSRKTGTQTCQSSLSPSSPHSPRCGSHGSTAQYLNFMSVQFDRWFLQVTHHRCQATPGRVHCLSLLQPTADGTSTQPSRDPSYNKTFRCPFKLMLVPREAMAASVSYASRMQTVIHVEYQHDTVFEGALGQNVLAGSMLVGRHVEPHCDDKRDI